MAIVDVESSLESSGKGDRGATGSGDQPSSPNQVSSSYLEKSTRKRTRDLHLLYIEGTRNQGLSPQYIVGKESSIGWLSIYLGGGVDIDDVAPVLAGGLSIIRGYDWASYDVSLYTSEYYTKKVLKWQVDRSCIFRDVKDARLIRLGVSRQNERVFHEKESSADDFFFVYTYLFNQLFVWVSFTAFQSAVLRALNVAPT